MPKQKPQFEHRPVLIQEVIDCLRPAAGQSYLDLTAGYGSHAQAILDVTQAPSEMVLVDRDERAVAALKQRFQGSGVKILHRDFLSALRYLTDEGKKFDMILADLGVSSPHLDDASRGFSFNLPGPLDMRMDQNQAEKAEQLVNELPPDELTDIIRRYGEEPRARAIARAITDARPVKTTDELAAIITQTVGWRAKRAKIHPATKTFQALRIAVNDELGQLERALPLMSGALAPGGRMAVISFHSLEDRVVKRFLADMAGNRYDSELQILTKKPIAASQIEIASNPRARSAKLRAAAKIKIQ